jgi:hypothetical protein
MGFFNFWTRSAHPVEQGSFCDKDSEIHYDNVSRSEALQQQATAEERGNEIVEGSYATTDYADSVRFNINITETDAQWHDHPVRYRPGK